MNHEDQAKLIKRIFYLVLALAISAAVYFYPEPKVELSAAAAVKDDRLLLVHHHLPADPASEQIADILNHVEKKYDKYLRVSRVDFKKSPEVAKVQGVTKPPHVIVFAGSEKIYEFQGPATEAQVERKIEEILRGLKRIDKNWRPPVPGMKPAVK